MTDFDVKVYKPTKKIVIGEEIPTSIKVIDTKGCVVEIPICFNCLKNPSITNYLCNTCLELEKIEDTILSYYKPDLITTNAYTPE